MINDLLLLKKEKKIYSFSLILILLLPYSVLLSSVFINFSIISLCLIFLFLNFKDKESFFLQDKFFILLLIFFIYILINSLLSVDFKVSFSRSIGFMRFVLFPFAIAYFIKKSNFRYAKLILQFWSLLFFFISVDLVFEFFLGNNIFGIGNNFPGRLSSILGSELKIGHYYYGFCLFSLSLIILMFKKKFLISVFAILIFTAISLIIGERANFIKFLFSVILFLFFWEHFKFKIKISILLIITLSIFSVINFNKDLSNRFNTQFTTYLFENGIERYYYDSQYGAHYTTALKIFKNYPLIGSGLKTFYNECSKNKYSDERFISNASRCTTHPHQLHLEILSQLGIMGYLIFLTLILYFLIRGIFNYQKYKNLLHLSGLIFIFTSIFLPLPSGSFFTTFGASIFWINVGVVLAFEKVEKSF